MGAALEQAPALGETVGGSRYSVITSESAGI